MTLLPQKVWTDEKVGQLKSLWADGATAAEACAILGVTRNAVLGKVHRMGLPLRSPTPIRFLKREMRVAVYQERATARQKAVDVKNKTKLEKALRFAVGMKASKTSATFRGALPRLGRMTATQQYAMLQQALLNTGARLVAEAS